VRFEKDGKTLIVIDTAGVRKKRHMVTNDIEFYSFHRAQRSIRRADVVLMLIDGAEPVSEPDKKLAQYIAEQFKPVVLVVNKWDFQTSVAPPTIVLFVNKAENFDQSFRRFVVNRFREKLPFDEVPIRLEFRGKGEAGERAANKTEHSSDRITTLQQEKRGKLGRAKKRAATGRRK
jgi:predicted GTPase